MVQRVSKKGHGLIQDIDVCDVVAYHPTKELGKGDAPNDRQAHTFKVETSSQASIYNEQYKLRPSRTNKTGKL